MQEIFVPALGMASDSVYLAEWLKQPGDTVAAGEVVASIETDKAELEIEAPQAGILGRHRYAGGSDVPSGATITAVLELGEVEAADGVSVHDGEAAPARAPAAPAPVDAAETAASETVAGTATAPNDGPRVRADRRRDGATGELEPYLLSPRARFEGSASRPELGPAAAEPSAPEPSSSVAPAVAVPSVAGGAGTAQAATDRYRAAVSAAVSRSWAEIPHFTAQREVRMERLLDVQRGFKALSRDVTLTDVIAKAYALALMERFGGRHIDLGLAVATPRGVAIPVITNVARRDVLDIARVRREAVARALDGRLSEDDSITPHSTISNLGAYGVDSFTGLVPVGQTSILTTGVSAARPVVENGELAVGMTMSVTLNVDHREWDGQHVGEVLKKFAAIAAEPFLLTGLAQ